VDDHDIDRLDEIPEENDDDQGQAPLLSFDNDSSMPHWSDPPTGEMPIIVSSSDEDDETSASSDSGGGGGSRLFPQLPDDPNMAADETEAPRPSSGIDLGGSLADGIDDLAPTGPIESVVPLVDPLGGAVEGDELPSPRWAGTLQDFDSTRSDLPSVPTDNDPVLSTGPVETAAIDKMIAEAPNVTEFDDDLDELLSGDDWTDDSSDDEEPTTDGTSAASAVDGPLAASDDRVHPSSGPATTPAAPERSGVALVRPIGSAPSKSTPVPVAGESAELSQGAEPEAATSEAGDADLGAWSALDDQAPLWREGAQEWDDTRDADSAAERTVLHLDDDDHRASRDGGADAPVPPSGSRNLPLAIATAVGLAVTFLFLVDRGPGWAMILVVPLLIVAASEFFVSVRKVGYRPATLLGLVATGAMSLAAYYGGPSAIPVVLMLTVVGGLLWYLFGVDSDRPTANLSVTLLGVLWVGLLGSYIPLILLLPNGSGILLGAIIGTATYDTAGLFIGRWTGQSRLAPSISPNKTWEGLIGGMIFAVLVVTFALGVQPGMYPWAASEVDALLLGVVVAVMAPLGDLVQSLIKRDLGVKDMGTALPGHGGVFDRFDALLFVLPAVYYLVLARDLHLIA